MKRIVTEGSLLSCSQSLSPSALKVTSQSFTKVEGLLIATEKDCISIENIPSFGNCMLCNPLQPCIPAPIKWEELSHVFIVGGYRSLTHYSKILCAKGGEISILETPNFSTKES